MSRWVPGKTFSLAAEKRLEWNIPHFTKERFLRFMKSWNWKSWTFVWCSRVAWVVPLRFGFVWWKLEMIFMLPLARNMFVGSWLEASPNDIFSWQRRVNVISLFCSQLRLGVALHSILLGIFRFERPRFKWHQRASWTFSIRMVVLSGKTVPLTSERNQYRFCPTWIIENVHQSNENVRHFIFHFNNFDWGKPLNLTQIFKRDEFIRKFQNPSIF